MTHKNDAEKRHAAIREILAHEIVQSQDQLLRILRGRSLRVTQSSISRDLLELRVAKVEGRYVLSEILLPERSAAPAMPDEVLSVIDLKPAGPNILVARTAPGLAPAVSAFIDRMFWPEVVGTVAGDDTLLIFSAGRRQQARIESRLNSHVRN